MVENKHPKNVEYAWNEGNTPTTKETPDESIIEAF